MVPDVKMLAPPVKKYIVGLPQSQECKEARHQSVAEAPSEPECKQVEDEAIGCARSEQKSTALPEAPECAAQCQHHHYGEPPCKRGLQATEGNKHTPNKENSHTQAPPPLTAHHAATQTLQANSVEEATQTEEVCGQETAANLIRDCGEVEHQSIGTQTGLEAHQHGSQTDTEAVLVLDFPKEKCSLTEDCCCTEGPGSNGRRSAASMGQKVASIDAAVQTHKCDDKPVSDLKVKIACLEEKLEIAQSTIIWQSLMLRLYHAETCF